MCGRTVFTLSKRRVARVSSISDPNRIPESIGGCKSYNVCPTDKLVCLVEELQTGMRTIQLMKWGIEPRFSSSQTLSTINARIEGVRTSKLYSLLIDRHRCVVLVDAFYEWDQRTPKHTPYLIRFRDDVKESPILSTEQLGVDDSPPTPDPEAVLPQGVSPLFLAAIYDSPPVSGGLSCSILTTDSHGPTAKVHTRMPVFLSPQTALAWLSGLPFDDIVGQVIKKCREISEDLFCTEVSPLVNSISNKSREVTLPVSEQKKRSFEKGLGRFFQVSSKKEEPDPKKVKTE